MTQPTLDLFVPAQYDKGRIVALLRRLQHGIDVAALLQPLAKGDLLYADTNTTIDGLAIGSAGKILRSTGTLPAWTTLTFPDTITRGGLIYGSASNVASVLAVGASGRILTSDGTDVSWATPAVPTTITVADTTDSTAFVALFESATGNLAPKTDAAITYDASTSTLTVPTVVGDLTGNADTVTTAVADESGVPINLLHFDDSDASTVITDSGTGPVSFTAFGNAQIDTAQSLFGGSSLLLDGTGDYVRGTIGARPAGEWTLQCFARFNASPSGSQQVMTWGLSSPERAGVQLYYNQPASQWELTLSSTGTSANIGTLTYSHTPTTGVWYHLAVVFTGTEYLFFFEGVERASVTSSTLVHSSSTELTLGSEATGVANFWNGWIEEAAVFHGAVWTVDFTPPTSPFSTALYPMLATEASGSLSPRTDAGLSYNPSSNALTATTFIGALTGSITGNAATVTHADETSDTSCFITFSTAASGSLPVKTNTNMTFNSSTGVATFASTVLTTTDINGGTVDGVTIGGSSAGAITGTTITANTGFMPDANDGAYLGQSGTAFSDLFLASGAVVDFAAGDVILTHSSNTLTLTGGVLVVPDTGLTVGASVPFSDSAGTLTLQNVDALDATTEATIEAAIDTLANLTSIQGRTVTLADAGANAFLGWDDTAGAYENLTASEALEIIKTVDGSGSGLAAETVTHANEATDTSCFITFSTAATGELGAKTNANMTFNSNTGVATFGQTIAGSVNGNAATATALQTPRTIGGTSFDGTANIVPATITVADTTDSSCSVALFESATGDLAPKTDGGLTYDASTGMLTATGLTGPLTGNASTATALQTARTIGGVSFDGTANIVPDTITVADESTDTTCRPLFVTTTSGALPPKTNSGFTFNSAIGGLGVSLLGVNVTPSAVSGDLLSVGGTFSGVTTQRGVNLDITYSGATTAAHAYRSVMTLADTGADITYSDVVGFNLGAVTKARAGDTVTKYSSVRAAQVTVAALNIGYESTYNASGTARYARYFSGTAPSHDDGQQLLANTDPVTLGQSNRVQVSGSGSIVGGIGLHQYSANANGSRIEFGKSRNATIGSNTIAQSGDVVADIRAYGANGSTYDPCAQIVAEIAGTPGASTDMPGRWRFLTTPDASATPLDRLWIEQDGSLQQYAIYTSSTSYSRLAHKVATTTLTSVSGATVTATNLIPAKARVVGVNTKVTVALGTGGGTTGYQVGDGTDADRWGNVTGTNTATDTDGNDATADPGGYFNAANNVVITANGGNFNGTGSIRIDVFYTLTEAD